MIRPKSAKSVVLQTILAIHLSIAPTDFYLVLKIFQLPMGTHADEAQLPAGGKNA
jgi:hypothetical protein